MQNSTGEIRHYHLEVPNTCSACGIYHEELVMARLTLISGQVIDRYICDRCLTEIKKMMEDKRNGCI